MPKLMLILLIKNYTINKHLREDLSCTLPDEAKWKRKTSEIKATIYFLRKCASTKYFSRNF